MTVGSCDMDRFYKKPVLSLYFFTIRSTIGVSFLGIIFVIFIYRVLVLSDDFF